MIKNLTWEDYKNNLRNEPETKKLVEESEGIAKVVSDIIAKRKEKGWSQADLAKVASLTQSYIARIENNIVMPKLDTLVKIWNALGVEPMIKDKNSFVFTMQEECATNMWEQVTQQVITIKIWEACLQRS